MPHLCSSHNTCSTILNKGLLLVVIIIIIITDLGNVHSFVERDWLVQALLDQDMGPDEAQTAIAQLDMIFRLAEVAKAMPDLMGQLGAPTPRVKANECPVITSMVTFMRLMC